MRDVIKTVQSEYGNSPTLLALINNFNAYIDPCVDIDNFYANVWDIDSAVGFGLDIWGRIVGVGRNLLIPQPLSYFGFSEGGPTAYPFGQQVFYNKETAPPQTYALPDTEYRSLIMAKALYNISTCSAPALNQLLKNLFPGIRCYVNDLGNMQMRYTFESILTPIQFAIITQSGVIPKPAGVKGIMTQTATLPVFGFKEAGPYGAAPFGQAPFLAEDATSAIS
jgi:hypothetical protein